MKKLRTFVIIPNWNGRELIGACLDSLAAQTVPCQIVVVDNGSTDGSVEFVQEKYPQVHLIELDRNYGFTGGVNPGLQYALDQGAENMALFNNDGVAEPDWLKFLLKAADEHPEAGIITSKFMQLRRKKYIDTTGDFYTIWGYAFPRGRDEIDHGQYDTPALQVVFGASGGATLYRAEVLRQIGLFDQDFFAYFEDIDISFRAQLAGWTVWYEPRAVAYNWVGWTSAQMGKGMKKTEGTFLLNDFTRYHSLKNYYFLYVKNMPGRLFWKYLPRFGLGMILIIGNSIKRGQFKPMARGLGQIILKTPSTLMKRYHIQHSRQVSDDYIDSILYHGIPPTQKALLRLKAKFRKAA